MSKTIEEMKQPEGEYYFCSCKKGYIVPRRVEIWKRLDSFDFYLYKQDGKAYLEYDNYERYSEADDSEIVFHCNNSLCSYFTNEIPRDVIRDNYPELDIDTISDAARDISENDLTSDLEDLVDEGGGGVREIEIWRKE